MIKEYTDERGIKRRVEVDLPSRNPIEGVPVDVYDILDERLKDTPMSFRRAFYDKLWQRNLIQVSDFKRRKARDQVREALLSSIACDATDIVRQIIGA